MKHPCQIFVEHELGAINSLQLIEWACEILSTDSLLASDFNVLELAGLRLQVQSDLDQADGHFRIIIKRHFPDFSFESPDAIRWTRETVRNRCNDYMQQRITPYEFCSIVLPIEQHFNFPSWLGNLFNACDWVDGHTKREDVPDLINEAKRIHDAV